MASGTKKDKVLEYKGRPLRRQDNTVYYGRMSDKYIIMLQILDSAPVQDISVASRVSVQLQYTDPELKTRDKVVRRAEKEGFYEAIDLGSVWLERALSAN